MVLTFLSRSEVLEQVNLLCQRLGYSGGRNLEDQDFLDSMQRYCADIIRAEGGENRSELAKQASAP